MPKGTIVPWYGNLSDIPKGFLYCDGTNGTPDLRGRTVIGTGSWVDIYGSNIYSLGESSGERIHTLTVAEMPRHNHQFIIYNTDGGGSTRNANDGYDWFGGYGTTEFSGGDQPHNNMMPYVALHWIMKV